jgi:putative addiction module component (TIGR02574 family)
MGHPAVNLDDLSPDEQLDLLGEIWERLSKHPARVPVSDAQRTELGRRVDDLEADIRDGRPLGEPWEQVRERLKKR